MLDVEQVNDVTSWLLMCSDTIRWRELGVLRHGDYSKRGSAGLTSRRSWSGVDKLLGKLIPALYKHISSPDHDQGSYIVFQSIVHNDYPAKFATNRGAHLAGFLPLVCEKDTPFRIGRKLSEAVLLTGHPQRHEP